MLALLQHTAQVPPKITSFPNMGYQSLCAASPPPHHHHHSHRRCSYATGPISVRSTCAHHFQNIVGKCWVGIVPETEVLRGGASTSSPPPFLMRAASGRWPLQVQPNCPPHMRAPPDSGGNDLPNCRRTERHRQDAPYVRHRLFVTCSPFSLAPLPLLSHEHAARCL